MPLRSGRVEAAARTLILLEELNRHRVVSVQALHATTGLPKATIVRLLRTLCDMGFAANDRRQGGYTVASRVKSLSNGYYGDPLVVEAARPWALAFTSEYHWPLAIGVLDGPSVVVRFSTTPDSPLAPLQSFINRRLSLLSRAMGRAYLAFCPASERAILFDLLTHSENPEDNFARESGSIDALLRRIRSQGFAERHPLIDPGSGTIAVPIVVGDKVLATVGMTFFSSALPQAERVESYVPRLQELARSVATTVASLK